MDFLRGIQFQTHFPRAGADPEKGGGPAEFSSKRGGGVQPLTREQFVLQINKIF